MGAKHGNLSINSENIFPIIKKWMYSDHDKIEKVRYDGRISTAG